MIVLLSVLLFSKKNATVEEIKGLEKIQQRTRIIEVNEDPCLKPLKEMALRYQRKEVSADDLYAVAKTCETTDYYLQIVWGIKGGDPNIIERILSW